MQFLWNSNLAPLIDIKSFIQVIYIYDLKKEKQFLWNFNLAPYIDIRSFIQIIYIGIYIQGDSE